jgi:hypothetical protein
MRKSELIKTCHLCRFWHPLDLDEDNDPVFGECRRYPPTFKRGRLDYTQFEVITTFAMYCGEYKGKD